MKERVSSRNKVIWSGRTLQKYSHSRYQNKENIVIYLTSSRNTYDRQAHHVGHILYMHYTQYKQAYKELYSQQSTKTTHMPLGQCQNILKSLGSMANSYHPTNRGQLFILQLPPYKLGQYHFLHNRPLVPHYRPLELTTSHCRTGIHYQMILNQKQAQSSIKHDISPIFLHLTTSQWRTGIHDH